MNKLSAHEIIEIFDSQLKTAQQIQRKIIPKVEDFKSDHYNFFAHLHPFRRVGGDFYDFNVFDDGCLSLILIDAMGHGIDAAMLTSMVKLIFSYAMRDESINHYPDEIMKRVNNDIEYLVDFSFFSGFTFTLDPNTDQIHWCNAGHPGPFLITKEGYISQLAAQMPLIGMQSMTATNYKYNITNFKKGDKLILFTDGLAEAKNINNAQYGIERIEMQLRRLQHSNLHTICSALLEDFNEFTRGTEASDDICLIGIEHK